MVLRDFEITGFRTFDHLRLDDLSDVNLLVGENSVGKTTVLEALRLYLTEDWSLMMYVLEAREEFSFRRKPARDRRSRLVEPLAWESLFYGRPSIMTRPSFQLGPRDMQQLKVSLVWIRLASRESDASVRYEIEDNPLSEIEPDLSLGLDIEFGRKIIIPPEKIDRAQFILSSNVGNYQIYYLSRADISDTEIGLSWDAVALTKDEDSIISVLKLVVPTLDKLVLVQSPRDNEHRLMMAKLSNFTEPVPLKSLGGGIYHILGVVLGLANSRDGVFLVDEIESGLHFSVQAKFWRVVRELAKAWNVQVFATTHSWDCVRGLQQAAAIGGENSASASLHRIERTRTGFKSVRFSAEEIAIADREDIEIR